MGRRSVGAWATLVVGVGWTLATAGAWGFTLFWSLEYAPAGIRNYSLAGGCLNTDIYFRSGRYLTVLRAAGEPVWFIQPARPLGWWFVAGAATWSDHVRVPLWAVALPGPGLVWAGGLGVAKVRRGARGFCRRCGYDLRSLGAAAVCPECGAAWPRRGGVPR